MIVIEGLLRSNLTKRVFTALVGLPVLLLVLFAFDGLFVVAALVLLTFLVLLEWTELADVGSQLWGKLLIAAIGATLVLGYWFAATAFPQTADFVLLGSLSITMASLVFIKDARLRYTVLWLVLCCVLGGTLIAVYAKLGSWGLVGVLAIAWGTDTAAYFVGRAIGKRPVAPTISPNKTVEGTVGGYVTGVFIAGCFAYFMLWESHTDNLGLLIALVLCTPALAIFGDLVESRFKRIVDAKDSGRFLPGHGGLLDRVDSLVFVPVGLLLLV